MTSGSHPDCCGIPEIDEAFNEEKIEREEMFQRIREAIRSRMAENEEFKDLIDKLNERMKAPSIESLEATYGDP